MDKNTWLNIVKLVAPLVLGSIPQTQKIAPFVAGGIQIAEQIPGATGPQKLEIAKALVHAGVGAVNAQVGHEHIPVDLTDKTLAEGISTVVDTTNLIHSIVASSKPLEIK